MSLLENNKIYFNININKNRRINIPAHEFIKDLIVIIGNGSCWYRAIYSLINNIKNNYDSEYYKIRNLSSNQLSDEYIKNYFMYAVSYFIFTDEDDDNYIKSNEPRAKEFRKIFGVAYSSHRFHSKEIFKYFSSDTQDIIRTLINHFIPNKNFLSLLEIDELSPKEELWGCLNILEKNNIKIIIKKIIKKINILTPVTYFDPIYEIEPILQWYFITENKNIIIVELTKQIEIQKYISYKIYTRNNGNYIDNNTFIGFITAEGNHTNILYGQLFKYDEIPTNMKEYFNMMIH